MSKKPSAETAQATLREKARQLAIKHASAAKPSYYAEPFEPHEWVVAAIMEALNPNGFDGREFFRLFDTATGKYKGAGGKWTNGGKTWNKLGHLKASLRISVGEAERRNERRKYYQAHPERAPAYAKYLLDEPLEVVKLPDTWVVECHNAEGGWRKPANEVMGFV